jgi:hypothetical protein
VDNTHYSNLDSILLDVRVEEIGGNQEFRLMIYFSEKDDKFGNPCIGYAASSKLNPTKLEDCCRGFVGPNLEYRNRLI